MLLFPDRKVMHVQFQQLQGWLKENPFHQQRLHTFGRERTSFTVSWRAGRIQALDYLSFLRQAIILPKNSPLTPALNQALLQLRESSLYDHLVARWIGKSVKEEEDGEASKTVLAGGQVQREKYQKSLKKQNCT